MNETKSSGIQNQSAEKLYSKLQGDVRQISDKRDTLENELHDRETHLSKLQGWDKSDRMTTEDDVRAKRIQLQDMEEQVAILQGMLLYLSKIYLINHHHYYYYYYYYYSIRTFGCCT